ncbi:proline iminopeptidase-family hydrolase [Tumebacillus permanentifrigoris]|uniref:Proline iminopeptidase n=1 Tax=Tumebacillus permanentifrigoris TaxID=378543 RepID=A0A316DD38_9BACL|nr:proline iminopeptidase-family hydrolase [Tumebacillus permanentifrigoris]PWK15606.1 proline iminopeptidase [Tumebacillus permanentifrigoris]
MREGYVEVTGGKVWYQVIGEGSDLPLLLLHGGPGSTGFGFENLEPLTDERQIVIYDQLGCGYSDRPDDVSLWQLDRFVEELEQVRHALGLKEFHLLGHSWGTMLAASYLQTRPQGVRSVIFSSPCLSALLWAKDQAEHLREFPQEMQETVARCEAEGTTDSEEYQAAIIQYYKRHLCRIDSPPRPEDRQTNSVVYNTMWGPSEFCATGNLKSYDVTSTLHEIEIPTLFLCGRYDETKPETLAYYQSLVPGSKLHVFEHSAHKAYLEETDEYVRVVREFLRTV